MQLNVDKNKRLNNTLINNILPKNDEPINTICNVTVTVTQCTRYVNVYRETRSILLPALHFPLIQLHNEAQTSKNNSAKIHPKPNVFTLLILWSYWLCYCKRPWFRSPARILTLGLILHSVHLGFSISLWISASEAESSDVSQHFAVRSVQVLERDFIYWKAAKRLYSGLGGFSLCCKRTTFISKKSHTVFCVKILRLKLSHCKFQ